MAAPQPQPREGLARVLRFLVAGAVNTLVGFVVFGLALRAGASTAAALLIGLLSGAVFNFFSTGGYAFRQLEARRYPAFLAAYLLVYLTNLGAIRLLSPWVEDPLVAQAVLTAPIAALSYLLMARFVFRPRPAHD